MTKQYYEAHVTLECPPSAREGLAALVRSLKWKFSSIDGDANLGSGVKCYATRQFNNRHGDDDAITRLWAVAKQLADSGYRVLRRKVEVVIYDDRIEKVACTGGCAECHTDDNPEHR